MGVNSIWRYHLTSIGISIIKIRQFHNSLILIIKITLTWKISFTLKQGPGGWFNIKMSSHKYRKSHCGDKTILRLSYLHNGFSYTGKMTSLYWIRAQMFLVIKMLLKRWYVRLCPFCRDESMHLWLCVSGAPCPYWNRLLASGHVCWLVMCEKLIPQCWYNVMEWCWQTTPGDTIPFNVTHVVYSGLMVCIWGFHCLWVHFQR